MPLTTTLAGGSALIKWLLRDEFTDTRAAGAVNGTPATPGPGTRAVANDDDVAVVVGGGRLSIPPLSVAAYGKPSVNYEAQTRGAGMVLLIQQIPGNFCYAGWCNTLPPTAGARWDNGILFRPTECFAYDGITGPSLAVYTTATEYAWALVLRASGAYTFIKGETEFPNWTLLRISGINNTATLYLTMSAQFGAIDADFVRVPDELYLPTPLAYDSFTRANGALGSTESAGPDGQTTPAHIWNNRVGTTLIAGNVASASALVGGIAIAAVDTAASADVNAQATLTRAGNEVGIIVRYVDADNYVRAVHDGTNCQLIKRVATAETTVITAAVAIGAGAIAVVCEGTQFSLFLNDAKIGATSTIADGALQSGTEQGLFSTNVGNTQDVLLVMPRGTSGEYSALNRWSA